MNVEELRGKSLQELEALLLEEKKKLKGVPPEKRDIARLNALNNACYDAVQAADIPTVVGHSNISMTFVQEPLRR